MPPRKNPKSLIVFLPNIMFCISFCVNLPKGFDPTFIASVFTGTLATFGVQTAKNKGKEGSVDGRTPTQIIKIEQKPIKIITED